MGNVATAPKSGKKAKKGFLGRLLGRSSKKGSKSKGAAMPAVGGDKEQPKKAGGDRETDPRDKP